MTKPQKVKVEISEKSIISTLLIILLAYFLFSIRNILAMILIAFIISSAFSPIIKFFVSKKIPKGLAVAIVYIMAAVIIFFLISLISVPIAKEVLRLINSLPGTVNNLIKKLNNIGIEPETIGVDTILSTLEKWSETISQNLGNLISAGAGGLSGVANIITGLFGGLISFISVIAIAIYTSLDKDNLYKIILLKITNPSTSNKLRKFISDLESALGSWFVGQSFLSAVIGILALITYSIVGLPYTGSLALLTALLNIIPNLGPIIAFIPAFILALSTGNPVTIVGTILGSIAIQQLEGNILAPKILSNAVGLPPLLILISILIGAQLFGATGVILAVPVSVIVHLSLSFLSKKD